MLVTVLMMQDCLHEREYAAMYRGLIPKNNNWGFYLYKTAKDRQKRILEYREKADGVDDVQRVGEGSPQQMRRISRFGKRSRSGSKARNSQRRLDDKKINKRLKKEFDNI